MAHPSQEQVANAFKAARRLGIKSEEIRPVLKDLFSAFKSWDDIEADNYRVLIETYFEVKEELEKMHQRPSKRSHLAEKGSQLPLKHSNDSGNVPFPRTVVSADGTVRLERDLRKPKVEVSTPSATFPRTVASADGTIHLERASKKPKVEVSITSVTLSAEQTSMKPLDGTVCLERALKKPKVEVSTLSATLSAEQTSMKPPGPMKGCVRRYRPNTDSNGAEITCEDSKPVQSRPDITKSTEKVPVSLVVDVGIKTLPKFNYIPQNIIHQNAKLNVSLSRIADEDCCTDCSGDCLSAALPCACAHETGGEFVYTLKGLLKEDFLSKRMSLIWEPEKQPLVYCQDCPHERIKNELMPEKCKGHVVRQFIKECWRKCGCDMRCGNRVVQRGISCKLQVFWTPEGKGWGVRTLDVLEKGAFVCEYVGEIMTNTELYDRTIKGTGTGRHTYPVILDADWGSENFLDDDHALCLDATLHGNVARFINHRCGDANLVDIPVQVETPDRHYYHIAFFTTRKVNAFEELTWDYGIDFYDNSHPIKAFKCTCGSSYCRNRTKKGKMC